MNYKSILYLLFILILACQDAFSQEKNIRIQGCVQDSTGTGLYLVNIIVTDSDRGTFTDKQGCFTLDIRSDNKEHTLKISSLGYDTLSYPFIANSDISSLLFILSESITSLNEVIVRERGITESPTIRRLPLRDISLIPSTSNSIEALLSTMPGVSSPNELSGQYTVRGGSYDENMVYINGIEMYKPQLIKSGRKEGLSTINPDMAGSLYFSAGGFDAKYGDKMSSVLDITYREPDRFRGSVSAGMLTSSAHLEGRSTNGKISIISGARYMTNRFLLKSLDTEANYSPYFYDFQSLITVSTGEYSSLGMFLTYGSNNYEFTPLSQRSSFGTYQEAYQLYVDYNGFEKDNYELFNLALSWNRRNDAGLESKIIARSYSTRETESFDIRARYALNLLDKDIGSENLGDSVMNVGIGSWLDHARNRLEARVYNLSGSTKWSHGNNIMNIGLSIKHELIDDSISEWKLIDSAGYSIPTSLSGFELFRSINASNQISSQRLEFYFTDNYTFEISDKSYIFTLGARASYWSLNKEFFISPRFSFEADYNNLAFYFSSGVYYQPPFYREMRRNDGSLNYNIRAQKSTHFVLGSRWDFLIGQTSFRLWSEAYYKKLEKLIPYRFDNVRVVYSGENSGTGNIAGVDLRLNGEFVKGVESWLSLSLMKATHDIVNDEYGSYPAPGDIRFSADLFFQDYFPGNTAFRAHIKLHYSSGMPVSSPYEDRYDRYFRMPSYKRVDLGFTRSFKDRLTRSESAGPFRHLEDIVLGFEIFNLLDMKNTISYHWLSTINNLSGEQRQFAVPNYLTGRSLNFKLRVEF